MGSELRSRSLATLHMCSLAGKGHFILDKNAAMPEINTGFLVLQKPRFCKGGECQLPTLEE